MKFTDAEISANLFDVANLFEEKAKDTILFENKGKHLLEIHLILKNLHKYGKILDVGGGMGINLLCLSRLIKQNAKLFLIDQFEEYDENNRMGSKFNGINILKDSNIFIIQQNFGMNYNLSFSNKNFDIITCFDVIEHLPSHPLNLFKEIKRLLKHKGIFIVGVPNAVSLHRRMKLLIGKHPYIPFDEWCEDNYYQHYREYTIDEMKKLLSKSGFKNIKTIISEEPIATMAQNKYHKQKHSSCSWISFALYIHHVISKLFPSLRQSLYCVAQNEDVVNH